MNVQALNASNTLVGTAAATRLAGRVASMDAYRALVVLLIEWLILWWMYRRRLFLRV